MRSACRGKRGDGERACAREVTLDNIAHMKNQLKALVSPWIGAAN